MMIAAADARPGYPNQCIGRLDEFGVGNGLDADIVRAVHHSCSHVDSFVTSSPDVLFVAHVFHPVDDLPVQHPTYLPTRC
jgi:hypothetical protein